MRTIGMLVYKDLAQQGKRLVTICAIIVAYSAIVGMSNGQNMSVNILATMLSGFCISAVLGVAYEDDQGGLVFLRSLPLKASGLVFGRYLAAFLIVLMLTASAGVPLLIMRPPGLQLPAIGAALFLAALAGLILAGLILVIYYRYGYRAVRSSFLWIFMAFMAMQIGLVGLAKSGVLGEGASEWLENAMANMDGLSSSAWTGTMPAIFVAALLAYACLGWLAACVLGKRDL